FELRGQEHGDKAYLFIQWREGNFSSRKSAMCAGLRYVGRHVVDTRVPAGEGWFGLANGEGRVHLTITRRLLDLQGQHADRTSDLHRDRGHMVSLFVRRTWLRLTWLWEQRKITLQQRWERR